MESPGNLELPRAFEDADIDHLVILIADMLERLMTHNDQIPLSPESLTRFHSRSPPGISVLEYLRRIVKYANVEKSCLLITLHYIDQICARVPHFTLSSLTCHRFVIASIVVSTKALCDAFCTNNHYAKIGGVRVAELNVLEKEFLAHIDWRLTCTREVLDAYYVNLIRTHSSGIYILGRSASPISSEGSDMETEQPTSPRMNDSSVGMIASPDSIATESSRPHVEPSTVLIERATLSPRMTTGPTIEQNMAFAALQQ
ncbi:cyclin-domain-containing protein, partial [Rickenella mellea]